MAKKKKSQHKYKAGDVFMHTSLNVKYRILEIIDFTEAPSYYGLFENLDNEENSYMGSIEQKWLDLIYRKVEE